MAKLIVERPRGGGGVGYPRAALRDWNPMEDAPRRVSMKRAWNDGRYHKWLNENLAPLRRFLRSNVGRPWDKVFSEISERICLDSAVQLHIWQHIEMEVCLSAIRVGRTYFDSCGKRVYREFVVDSRTRLLQCCTRVDTRKRRGPIPPPPPKFLRGKKGTCLRQVDGIWYEFRLSPIPEDCSGLVDVFFRRKLKDVHRRELEREHGGPVFAVNKRQLNSKEIRRLPKLS
jgi:hypothetical protein